MPPELPPGMGPYEQWPGYRQLKQRLETWFQALNFGSTGFVYLDLELSRNTNSIVHRLVVTDLQLVVPANKDEFQKAGHSIRVAFSVGDEKGEQFLAGILKQDFVKYGVFRICLWANSGHSNNAVAVYKAMILNESRPEIYLQSLSAGRYEIGLDAHGNLFDALLLSDEVRRP